MANLKSIKLRLKAVKNTKKITYAMKLVSAAKLRKAQESVTKAREFNDSLLKLLAELSSEQLDADFVHPLMQKREVKRARILIIGGNRGLCGAYNTNVSKRTEQTIRELSAQGIALDFVVVGRKPAEYFRRLNRSYLKSFEELPEDANLWPIAEICEEIEIDFSTGKIDAVYLIFTKFKSALSQTVLSEKLLPLEASSNEVLNSSLGGNSTTLFEPSVQAVFSAIMPRIMRSRVRQACLDSKASEYGSRMTAMDAATKNSTELITKLGLTYNRIRQSKITSELLDIIGGAEALN